MSETAIKDFPMEGAMMSDMVALAVIEAMVSSDLGKQLENPAARMTAPASFRERGKATPSGSI